MKNITVAIADDVYREARIRAAKHNTSVSALVAEFLRSLTESKAEFERLRAQQAAVMAEIKEFRGEDRLGRDELYDRTIR